MDLKLEGVTIGQPVHDRVEPVRSSTSLTGLVATPSMTTGDIALKVHVEFHRNNAYQNQSRDCQFKVICDSKTSRDNFGTSCARDNQHKRNGALLPFR